MLKPKRTRRHSLAQKLVLFINTLLVLGCFGGAVALVIGQGLVKSQKKVDLVANLADAAQAQLGPSETFPVADPQAKNFLITGADNNSCVDQNSPFAGAFGDRTSLGERSDTIMIMRVDPSTNQAAVLSFPRDLWVTIAGRDGESRINSAYVKNDPSTLVATIYQNFGIGIDHFIQVDFCAFKTLVDAVGGVPVPFQAATRDAHTGLNIPQPGCFTLSGDHALAYVRSRHYETYDATKNEWVEDPLADLGRISRQQDFLRRIIAKALKTGVYTPAVARGLISTAQKYVVTDANLTPQRMLEFAGTIQNIDPANLHSYQIEVKRDIRGGNDVLIPRLGDLPRQGATGRRARTGHRDGRRQRDDHHDDDRVERWRSAHDGARADHQRACRRSQPDHRRRDGQRQGRGAAEGHAVLTRRSASGSVFSDAAG